MAEKIDFTNCRVVPGRAYNGANGKKIAVEYDGILYMLKSHPPARISPPGFPIPIAVSASISQAVSSI